MPLLSGILDGYVIQPIAKTKEKLAVFTSGGYEFYRVQFIEGIIPGPANTIDAVALAGAVALAAFGTINKQVVPILQLYDTEILHLRWEPLDNVEGKLWELSGQERNKARNFASRVDRNSRQFDPNLSTTTFFLMGKQRDMNLEVRNPMAYAIPAARFIFWGNRMVVEEISVDALTPAPTTEEKTLLKGGDHEMIKRFIGPVTYLPTRGLES